MTKNERNEWLKTTQKSIVSFLNSSSDTRFSLRACVQPIRRGLVGKKRSRRARVPPTMTSRVKRMRKKQKREKKSGWRGFSAQYARRVHREKSQREREKKNLQLHALFLSLPLLSLNPPLQAFLRDDDRAIWYIYYT